MQLIPKVSTTIHPVKKPPLLCNKWGVHEDDGQPVTTLQGQGRGPRYFEHPDETAMLRKLKPIFREYEIISIPDPHRPTHALYEARQLVPLVAQAETVATETAVTASTGNLF
jgi:hypothetical protein